MSTKRLPFGQSSESPDYEIKAPRPAIPAPGQPGTLREQLCKGQSLPKTCRKELQSKGRRRKDRGMTAALVGKCILVTQGQLALLEAIQRSPIGTASIDDATTDLSKKFPDCGYWRGSVPKLLAKWGIIERDGYVTSCRPSRHACPVTRWRLIDRAKAEALAQELREALALLVAVNEPQQSQVSQGGNSGDE